MVDFKPSLPPIFAARNCDHILQISMLNQLHPAVLWSILGFVSLALFSWYSTPNPGVTMANKAAIVVPAIKKHSATIIMAHGLGDR